MDLVFSAELYLLGDKKDNESACFFFPFCLRESERLK